LLPARPEVSKDRTGDDVARKRYAYCGEATTEEVGAIGDIAVELATAPPSPSGSGDIDQELATISGLATIEDVGAGASACAA
jgi:hypothetical protein